MTNAEQERLWEDSGVEMKDEEAAKLPAEQEKMGKRRVKLIDRQQMIMRTIDVEGLVEEGHEVRAIWEISGQLDLSAYYEQIQVREDGAGRSATDPRLLVSLWVYAYSKGISSAREIERLCGHDPAFQWLTGMQEICHHTLSSFRSGNEEALRGLFVQVLGVLSSEELITLEQVMQDGTKVQAYAGKDTFRREERLREHMEAAQRQVEKMEELDEAEVGPRIAKARQRAAREKCERLELAMQELEKLRAEKAESDKDKVRVSETDPQSRVMKQSDGGFAPSYNVQLSTDEAAGIIVAVDVVQAGVDAHQLLPAADHIEAETGQLPKQFVADAGYTNRSNIVEMERRGIDFIGDLGTGITKTPNSLTTSGVAKEFYPQAFVRNEGDDTYTCPAGKTLELVRITKRVGFAEHQYSTAAGACLACPFKQQCCPRNAKGRLLTRLVDDPAVAAFKEKMETQAAKDAYKRRSPVAEFPFACIKARFQLRQFRLRGLTKVTMEATWACLTYNITQWIRLCWRPRRCAAVT